MRLYFDLDRGRFVTGPGTNEPLTLLEAKRGDSLAVEVQFCRSIVIQELAGGATGKIGAKESGDYDGDFVVSSGSWAKTGSGNSTIYTFEINLNTSELNALMGIGIPGEDPDSVDLMFELEFLVDDVRTSSQTVTLRINNDVVRGTESGPAEISEGTPTNGLHSQWDAVLANNPTAGKTITIGSEVYTFADTALVAGDVQIGATAADTVDNIVSEVSGAGIGDAHPDVEPSVGVTAELILRAVVPGTAGDAIEVELSHPDDWTGEDGFLNGGEDPSPGVIGAMKVDEDFLYVLCKLESLTMLETEYLVPTWKKIALAALE